MANNLVERRMSRRLIIQDAASRMPSKVRHRYRHVAVIELDDDVPEGFRPAMISNRARGVKQIIWHSGPCSTGKTERCAFARAMATARQIVANETHVTVEL